MAAKHSLAPILWPLGVITMLGLSLSVCALTVIAATSDKSFAIEDDYYAKAVAWDETAAQRDRNERLGWVADTTVTDSGQVHVSLTDAGGQPIAGAAVTALAFHHAARGDAAELRLGESGAPGHYFGNVECPREGVWQIRLRATVQGETFTATADSYTRSEPE